MKNHRWLIMSFFILSACAESQSPAISSTKVEIQQDSDQSLTTKHYIKQHLVQNWQKNTFANDFNGDGIIDTLYIINTAEMDLKKIENLTIEHLWIYNKEKLKEAKSKGFNVTSSINLLVVWGEQTSPKLPVTLLHHYTSKPSRLQHIDELGGVSVVPKSQKQKLDHPEVADLAKGDIIVLPTAAAIDNYVHWNGQAFVEYIPDELP